VLLGNDYRFNEYLPMAITALRPDSSQSAESLIRFAISEKDSLDAHAKGDLQTNVGSPKLLLARNS
jgi:hypothetical protein